MGKSIRNLSTVTRVGLDLAKNAFQVHAVDATGAIVVARKLMRGRLVPFFAELAPCVVAMEACASAHHWGRALIELGHEVRLLPPAHVKPYVRRNKNDAVDAAAICEAAGRPGQRFVPVRSIDNQADLMRHRSARAARRPAHGASQRFARPSGRNRPRRAAGREPCLWTEAHGWPTVSTRMARSSSPIACAAHFVRLSAKSTRSMRPSERSTGSLRRRSRRTRRPSG